MRVPVSIAATAVLTGLFFAGQFVPRAHPAALPPPSAVAAPASSSQTRSASSVSPELAFERKLTRRVRRVRRARPKRGEEYARRVAHLIVRNARARRLPPEVVAATASIESDFSMTAGPCVGMMQINPETFHERHEASGLNPKYLSDNIRLGVRELARHYNQTSRHAPQRQRLAEMWGHYNGAGPRSRYVRRALRAYDSLRAEG